MTKWLHSAWLWLLCAFFSLSHFCYHLLAFDLINVVQANEFKYSQFHRERDRKKSKHPEQLKHSIELEITGAQWHLHKQKLMCVFLSHAKYMWAFSFVSEIWNFSTLIVRQWLHEIYRNYTIITIYLIQFGQLGIKFYVKKSVKFRYDKNACDDFCCVQFL